MRDINIRGTSCSLVPQEEDLSSASQAPPPSCRGLVDLEGGSEVEFQTRISSYLNPGSQELVRSKVTNTVPAGQGADHYYKTFLLGNFIAI